MADSDVRSRLAEVAVPALVLHWRSDFVPLSEAALMARGIRGARLVELEGSDHIPWVGGGSGKRVAAAPAARTRRPATGWEALTDAERRVASG